MTKIVLTYGIISGVVVIGSMLFGLSMGVDDSSVVNLEYIGYLIMLVALAAIAVGIKKYRDEELGGVITFGTATMVGLGIAAVAGVMYVVVWEIYLAMTDHAFIGDYVAASIESKKAAGLSGAELNAYVADMEEMEVNYANPLYRLPLTFLEIFPVGLLITLVSAAVLRKSELTN